MPIAFRNQQPERPRATPKRKAATFREAQSPLSKQQRRAFGTDITNRAHTRPVFKPNRSESAPVKKPLELLKDGQGPKTPVKFTAARNNDELDNDDLEASPLSLPKPRTQNSPLATLIEARALELKMHRPSTEAVAVDLESVEQWNPVCAIKSDMIIMNPRRIPLEHAEVRKYSDKTCVAGVW